MDNNTKIFSNDLLAALEIAINQSGYTYSKFMKEMGLAIKHNFPNTYTSTSSAWRDDIKSQFLGRGRQWFYTSLETVNPVLDEFDKKGDDTSAYRNNINSAGKAWVRFSSVAGSENDPKLKVEVRINGSKHDHKNNCMFIDITDDSFLDNLERLEDGKTPFSLGLESVKDNSNNTVAVKDNSNNTIAVKDNTTDTVMEEIDELANFINNASSELESLMAVDQDDNIGDMENDDDDTDDIDAILGGI